MPTPEGKFKGDFQSSLKYTFNFDIWIEATHHSFRKGLPDLIGSLFGRAFGFELKVDAKLEEIQKVELHRLAQADAIAGEVRLIKATKQIRWTRFRANSIDAPLTFTNVFTFIDHLKEIVAR